ncbi:MAG: protein-methionine-sulfoxide reductase catalytic subunit MsrP [Candidatus Methylomirabilota bacterium]|nr:protein-methionine-sulfoxide reductase catalytic subunit MsrP [candidate division NC10 bacterium]PWB44279.1 MAG: protein-methionine-sulfoxide reductase catalytic subunit MsrP [candidate division NC10 bacterium]
MLIRHAPDMAPSEITDYKLYLNRRSFLIGMAALLLTPTGSTAATPPSTGERLPASRSQRYSVDESLTSLENITTYNNFWEFGPNKDDPSRLAHLLKPRPWTVQIDGYVARPGRYNVEELMRLFPLEERIYRLRCVEGWSMVIPWIGYPLASLIKRVAPTSKARFVEFTTLHDPAQFPGQRKGLFNLSSLDWPYVEGLRLDEALHPLTLLTFGLYGQVLPNQDGAPVRVVVPWKYGFKSAKSIVRIRFVSEQPKTTWEKAAPSEYGFYSNVNPDVDHPRWSQGTERRIGEFRRRKTLMFNGYADQIASLYAGMDLRRNF